MDALYLETRSRDLHVVFISDYDMSVTEQLVGGVDLWINTPRRPWEACGTSGMKVLVNGGLNLSELDGWWAEAYSPEVGWAIGDGNTMGMNPLGMLKKPIYSTIFWKMKSSLFYNRNHEGIPTAWVGRIRESMAQLTPRFSTNRSVREYTEKYYLPSRRKLSKTNRRSKSPSRANCELAKPYKRGRIQDSIWSH